MATFDSLLKRSQALIRKGLDGAVFVAPYSESAEITKLLGDDGQLNAIPEGYMDVGHITKDQGLSWTRDINVEDVESLGVAEPTRRDITQDVSGLEFTMQESKAKTLELYEGVDLSSIVAKAAGSTHSNIVFDKPDRPALIFYRVLAIFKDGEGADAFYFGKWLPRVQVTDRGEQEWNEGTEIQYPVTLTAYNDDQYGTSMRSLWGFPTKALTAAGFKASTGS